MTEPTDIEEKKRYLSRYLLQQTKIARLSRMMAVCPEKSGRCRAEIRRAKKLRDEIEEKIQQVDDDVLQEILYQKYVCGESLLQVSESMNYSKRHLERLHRKALTQFRL